MRKQTVGIALGLGFVLLSYQNCSNGMHADQAVQNFVDNENMKQPEPDTSELMKAEAAGVKICPATDLKLIWPLGGTAYKNWTITNYVDLDSSNSLRDYTGATGASAVTYDGHRGVDIPVPSFRYTDIFPTPVYAAADGTVMTIEQGQPDHNTSCVTNAWNVVSIKHANGFKSLYGHLKKDSVKVSVGQTVKAGDLIAYVGSSGCSNVPHLHFEIADCNAKTIDPFAAKMLLNPPVYVRQAPATLMDSVMKQPTITMTSSMLDPGDDQTSFAADSLFSLGMTVAAAKPNDVLRLEFVEPSGAVSSLYFERKITASYPLSHWWWNLYLHQPGAWKVRLKVNGSVQSTRDFQIQ